jgi:hypothetical protein
MSHQAEGIIFRSKHLQQIQTIHFFHRNVRATAVAPEARVAPGDAVAIAQDRAEGVAGGAQLLDVVQLLLSHGERNTYPYIYMYYIWNIFGEVYGDHIWQSTLIPYSEYKNVICNFKFIVLENFRIWL